MRRLSLILLTTACVAALLLPRTAAAQIEKQVEVTKDYVPRVQQAAKLAVVPDLTDTTRMRPEIDYTVTPLSLNSPIDIQPIRPAMLSYWTFNRPVPFYLKLGAGYPLNTVADLYAATQHPDTGYALAYINHTGRLADLCNSFGVRNNSTQMLNRIGIAGGKYFGRHTLEGHLSYENRLYHRYGAYAAPATDGWLPAAPGAQIDFGDANLLLRFGDDFQDLSRINFDVALAGNLFYDQTVWSSLADRPRQTTLRVDGRIARAFGKQRLSLDLGYAWTGGRRALDGYRQQLIHAGGSYAAEGSWIDFEAGLDYYHDRLAGNGKHNYFLPRLRFAFDLGTAAMRPFVEIDGSLQEQSYRALTREVPYVVPGTYGTRSAVDYNGRLGIRGALWRDQFVYRLYAACTIRDNHNYWYGVGVAPLPDAGEAFDPSLGGDPLATLDPKAPVTPSMELDAADLTHFAAYGAMLPVQGHQTVVSFHGEAEFRPVSALQFELGVHGYLYNDDLDLCNGSPALEANFGIRYSVKRITLGASLSGQTARKWTILYATDRLGGSGRTTFTDSASLNLRFTFDWRITGRFGLFVEGDNLLNQQQYSFPWYTDYGANFTAGVKLAF